jgi:RNA polymerase primary sigma factor
MIEHMETDLEDLRDQSVESSITALIKTGRKKTFLTLDDILEVLPEAEHDIDLLEHIYTILLNEGIPYLEEVPAEEPNEEELALGEEETTSVETEAASDDLEHIGADDTIGLYLKEVSRVPLLNADEEVELAQRTERGRLAREELARGGVSSSRRQVLRQMIEDGWNAREQLITANSRLVISVAKKYMGRGVPFLDLIQEGNIGLIRSTKKFDYRRGHKFSTYATWWIRQAITRAIADQGRTIRVPVHMGDRINKMLRAQHQLTQDLGRDPTVQELAENLDLSAQKVENIIQVSRRPLSLETPTDDEGDSVLSDFIEDDQELPPAESATLNMLQEHIKSILDSLPPREVRILQLRYGLLDGKSYTLEEVGRKMGVTRERVRQIEAQALGRLRDPKIRQILRDYL